MTTFEKEINKALTCKYSNRRKRAIKNVFSYMNEHYKDDFTKITKANPEVADVIKAIDEHLAKAPEGEQLTSEVVKKEDTRPRKRDQKKAKKEEPKSDLDIQIDVVDNLTKAQEVAKANGIQIIKDNRFKAPKIAGNKVLLGEKFFENNKPTSAELVALLTGN